MIDAMPGEPASAEQRSLVRALTVVPATAVIVSNVVGTGVFVKSRVMTCNVGSPITVLVVWLFAGVLTMAGALVYAELTSMMPRAGGEYTFLNAAYGRACAFFFAWSRIIASSISGAAIAILFAGAFNDLVGGGLPDWFRWAMPIAVIVVVSALNVLPAKSSGWITTALTAIKVSAVLAVGIGACVFADGSWDHFAQQCTNDIGDDVPLSARGGIAGFGAAMLGALWAYSGWNVVAYLGGETKDPGRTFPRSLIGGCALVIALYLLINTAYFYVLSPQEVAAVSPDSTVAREVVAKFLGKAAAGAMVLTLLVSAYGTMHAGTLAVTRLPFALARDGLFPRWLGWLSPAGVPVASVAAMGVVCALLTLTGSFDVLTDVYIFVLYVFYGLIIAGLFVLRRKYPDALRPFRLSARWGYPTVPVLFLLATGFLLINTFLATPGRAIAGLGLIALGLPVYWYYAPRAAEQSSGELFAAEAA
jgi:APA family basic amino acid/polyamine antiporter